MAPGGKQKIQKSMRVTVSSIFRKEVRIEKNRWIGLIQPGALFAEGRGVTATSPQFMKQI